MKTGNRARLSEKLNAELDEIRQKHVAPISSQLKSFRIGLKNIVGAAQHTIASDTRRFQTETASFFWTVHLTRSELTEMGLTRIERPEGTWLILDPSKTRLRTCTMGERHVTCIRIEED